MTAGGADHRTTRRAAMPASQLDTYKARERMALFASTRDPAFYMVEFDAEMKRGSNRV